MYLEDTNVQLVKTHLFDRLKKSIFPAHLKMIDGIGKYLNEREVNSFIDPLIKYAAAHPNKPLTPKLLDTLSNQYIYTDPDVDTVIAKRLDQWAELYKEKNKLEIANQIDAVRGSFDLDLPF